MTQLKLQVIPRTCPKVLAQVGLTQKSHVLHQQNELHIGIMLNRGVPPLLSQPSPQSIHSAIALHSLDPSTYHSIINGLVITSEAHLHQFNQQFATQEEAHKKKLDDLDETIEFLKAC